MIHVHLNILLGGACTKTLQRQQGNVCSCEMQNNEHGCNINYTIEKIFNHCYMYIFLSQFCK